MTKRGPCWSAISIEEEQLWVTLPGLDVSLGETTICIVNGAGRIVQGARAASEPEALEAFFGTCGLVMERIGLEACSLSAWLHKGLTEVGLPAVCIEARWARAAIGHAQ